METRPWGFFITLAEGDQFKIKQIVVNPGKRLSYQVHSQRNEHWYILQGEALVIKNGIEYHLTNKASIDIPIGCLHRISNNGIEPLIFFEIQTGQYLGEDDIVRLEDDFGRK